MIENAQYLKDGSIVILIDGQEMTVPDDMANRHRIMLADWEAEGNVIEPYVEPILTPEELRAAMPDKTPREFRDILTDMGIFPQMVTDAINQIPFDIERQKALNAWEVMTSASRIDPYIDMIGAMFDKTPEQIDEAWIGITI